MAISPNQEYQLAAAIRKIYEESESVLLQLIAKRLMEQGSAADWQLLKLQQLTPLLAQARKETNSLDRRIPIEIQKVINLAYLAGAESAAGDLQEALNAINAGDADIEDHPEIARVAVMDPENPKIVNIDATMATFGGVNTAAVEALAATTIGIATQTHVPILRAVNDKYRQIVSEVAFLPLTGVETRREATQRALNKFLSDGITHFRDTRGRNWEIATYSEMAVRAAVGQASIQGHADQMDKYGFDLVQVSEHQEECDLCRPWEGKILSRNGRDPDHEPLSKAVSAGLFHPNCGHRLQTYFPGISTKLGDKKTEDPDGYRERQQQRYIERGIRRWKKKQNIAMTDAEKQRVQKGIEFWTNRMEVFIEETGRYRKREREQIKKAR